MGLIVPRVQAVPPPNSNLISNHDGQILFAVAFEIFRHGILDRAEIVYVHATDSNHARHQFLISHPNRNTHRMVAAAPVIGYFAEDEHGEVLSV